MSDWRTSKPADMYAIERAKSMFAVGDRVHVLTIKYKDRGVEKSPPRRIRGTVVGIYRYFMVLEYEKGLQESFTWAECVTMGYKPEGKKEEN